MKVYMLETKKSEPISGRKHRFFFKTKEDADKFLYVFKDHWCHVEFIGQYVDSNQYIGESDRLDIMNEDPAKRAERSLNWGFHFARNNGDDELNVYERAFIRQIHKRTSQLV